MPEHRHNSRPSSAGDIYKRMSKPILVKGQAVSTEPAKGVFSSGLCDCTADWCSCCAVLCCSPITVAQLFTKCVHPPLPLLTFVGMQFSIL